MADDKSYKGIANDVAQYLSCVNSHAFTADNIDRQFNIKTRDAKRYRWQILEEMVNKGLLEKMGTGKYRQIVTDLKPMDWQNADVEDTIKVAWPLNLQKWVKTYHRSIIVIAGSTGAGKTAFIYDFLLRNMYNKMGVVLFTNDMTAEEIKERMIMSEIEIPNPAPFKIYDRADNFGDVIIPNAINLIDYLDMNSEVYLIGNEIEKIYNKLDKGIAVIGIQKKPYQDVGVGGMFSIKRSKLYLTLDSVKEGADLYHKLTINKARGRTDPAVNPRYMTFKFYLVGGIKFVKKGD